MSEDTRWSYLAGYLHDGRPFQQSINPSWDEKGYEIVKAVILNRGSILVEQRGLSKEQVCALEQSVAALLPSCNGTLKETVEAEIKRLLNG